MNRKLILLASCAAVLVFGGAALAAKPDNAGKPDKEHGSKSDDRGGKPDEAGGGKGLNKGKADKNQGAGKDKERDNNSDCGLGRRDDGDTGARDPDDERGDDCPANDEHGKSDDDHRKSGEDHGKAGDDSNDDRRSGDADDEAAQPKTERPKRRWRWPWEPKEE